MSPVLLLLACAAPPGDTGRAPVEDPTPWVYDEPASDPPSPLDAASLETALAEVVAELLRIDPRLPLDAYLDGLARLDTTCPSVTEHNGGDLAEGDCTAASGSSFYGYEVSAHIEDVLVPCGTIACLDKDHRVMTGVSEIRGADGLLVQSFGDADSREYTNETSDPAFDVYLWGDFYREGAGTDDWLSDGLGVQLYAGLVTRAHDRDVWWSGGVTRMSGVVRAMVLDTLAISTATDACAIEPTGGLRLWDSAGVWYDVVEDETCDGCRDVQVDGTSLGSVSTDWTPLVTWETTPWDP
jgi:hypothetical protein